MVSRFLRRFTRPILWFATTLHFVWGVSLVLAAHTVSRTVGLAPFSGQPQLFGLLMFTSAVVATIALTYEALGKPVNVLTFWAFIPQQAFLMVSAASAVYYAVHMRYAGGPQIPPPKALFILVDQLPLVLLALSHPFGILRMHLPILPHDVVHGNGMTAPGTPEATDDGV